MESRDTFRPPGCLLGMVFALSCTAATCAASVVVDNDDPECTVLSGGAWSTYSADGQWGDDYLWKATDDSPAGVVEWRPVIPATDDYEVAVWYRSTGSGRPNDAHYTVSCDEGTFEVYVDQQTDGSQWVVLGTYRFAAGITGSVTLTSDAQAGKNIVADAVRFHVSGPAFRGFWADAFHQGFKSTVEIDSLIARALEGNYNAIVPEVLAYQDTSGGGHGAYWNSSIVPKATDIVGGIDPLAYLVQQAHAAGLEVHAWLVTYRVSTSWPPSGNSLLTAHPEWIMVPEADMGLGPATVGGKYTLDPGSPEVQEHLISIVRELVTNYEIDGINWDYVRYVQTDAGYPADSSYDKSGLARFQQITGYVGTPPPTGETSWNDFRRRTISELVRRCRAEMEAVTSNPRQPLCLSADLVCFGSAPSSFTSTDAYNLHQNWRLWVEQGWLDAGMPMNYKRESTHYSAYRSWIDAVLDWRYDRHMYCGQGNYLNTKADSITQMQYVYDAGANGSMNYSYASTADEDQDGYTEADWTWYATVAAGIFTAPVPLPDMPWRDPAQADEGTLWGQITDHTTGLPLDDATVQVGTLDAVQTDGNGYYVATLVPATQAGVDYALSVSKAGYPPATRTGITVFAGSIDRCDVPLGAPPAGPGDMDGDGDIDEDDLPVFLYCLCGPEVTFPEGHMCRDGDADDDHDVDSVDFASFQRGFEASE